MNIKPSKNDEKDRIIRDRMPLHNRLYRLLSTKTVHNSSSIFRWILIVIGLIVFCYLFEGFIYTHYPNFGIFGTHQGFRPDFYTLQLNNPGPMKKQGAEPLPNFSTNTFQIGQQDIQPIRTFSKPEEHPLPAVGLTNLFDLDKCTTYEDRYRPYEDTTLQMTYLQDYSSTQSDDFWIHAQEQRKSLIALNIKAEKEGGFIDWAKVIEVHHRQNKPAKRALVLRTYENYTWGRDDIRNVRALIVELSQLSKPEERYDVHILLDVHTPNSSFVISDRQRLAILQRSIPREFWSITTLWSEEQMAWLYAGLSGQLRNHQELTNSYRSCFMPVQVFSKEHPQYDFIWNWEMDTRSTQEYGETLTKITEYTEQATLDHFLENQSHWLIPASTVPSVTGSRVKNDADLITLNPIFDSQDSGYYWSFDYQNFPNETFRKASIGKNVRFSKRLLTAMSDTNSDEKISAHCENYASTILAYKAQSEKNNHWKGVYVPHPIYTRHIWTEEQLFKVVNRHDIYKKVNEKVLRDFSFYYDGAFAKDIYDVWRNNSNVCRTPSLLHPIKRQL